MLSDIIFVSNETKIYDFCFIYPFYWTSFIDIKIKFNNYYKATHFFSPLFGFSF